MLHGQCLAVGLRGVEGDFESAASADHHAAQHAAVRPAHGNGGARFAVAGDRGTGAVDGRVGDHLRWGGVGCSEVHGPCAVTQVVSGFDGQAFAVALWRVEGDVETAVATHSGAAQHIAVGVTHGDDGAALALAGKVNASGIDGQPGGLQRAVDIGRHDGYGRGVASWVAQYHVQLLAVGLRRVQDHADHTAGTDLGAAQHSTVGADDLRGGARFAATGEQPAIGAQLQFAGFVGRGDIGGGDLCR